MRLVPCPRNPVSGTAEEFRCAPCPGKPLFRHGLGFSPRSVPEEPRFGHGQKILSVFSVRSNLVRSQQAIFALSPCKLKHIMKMFAKTKK